jgi:hypothetical protein
LSTGTNTADRITVGLCRKVVGELELLQSLTGLSKTDIVNRAVTLYAFVTEQTTAGKDLLVRDGNTGEVERVRLL